MVVISLDISFVFFFFFLFFWGGGGGGWGRGAHKYQYYLSTSLVSNVFIQIADCALLLILMAGILP
jgi:hypothetical protein